jgi:hypothetical protein
MTERKTVEFDDAPNAEQIAAYKARIEAARQRTPVGGAQPLRGTPNLVEATEQAKSPQLPEQDRAYKPDELRALIEQGRAVPGIGAGIPAAQAASLGAKPTVGLRPETLEGLQALEAQAQAAQGTPPPEAAEPEEDESPPMDPEFVKALMGGYVDKMQRKETVFSKKFTDFCNHPFLVLQDMWVNFTWFNERVRDQIDVESLGNG